MLHIQTKKVRPTIIYELPEPVITTPGSEMSDLM